MSRPSIAISLTVDERKELEKQIRQTKGRKKADRLRVILYKAEGHSNKFIAKLLQEASCIYLWYSTSGPVKK